MHFPAADLIRIVEAVLPARFGGGPTDYQLVERAEGPLARVVVLVSPRVGTVHEPDVAAAVLDGLAIGGAGQRMMAAYWRSAGVIEVVRREPRATSTGKIPALDRTPAAAARS
jgi:hypothetical protein